MTQITRRYELDMGHCLPHHGGKCYRPHGHRYRVEATVEGELHTLGEETGMVVDFARLHHAMEYVLEPFDHRFLMSADDLRLQAMAEVFTGRDDDSTGVLVMDESPTAEHLAEMWAFQIGEMLDPETSLIRLRVYETPNCWADWTP